MVVLLGVRQFLSHNRSAWSADILCGMSLAQWNASRTFSCCRQRFRSTSRQVAGSYLISNTVWVIEQQCFRELRTSLATLIARPAKMVNSEKRMNLEKRVQSVDILNDKILVATANLGGNTWDATLTVIDYSTKEVMATVKQPCGCAAACWTTLGHRAVCAEDSGDVKVRIDCWMERGPKLVASTCRAQGHVSIFFEHHHFYRVGGEQLEQVVQHPRRGVEERQEILEDEELHSHVSYSLGSPTFIVRYNTSSPPAYLVKT